LESKSPTVPVQVQSSIPELNNLSTSQLYELLHDDQYLDDFVEELPPIKAFNNELDELMEEAEKLAKENLEKDALLRELKASVESLSTEFVNLGAQYSQTNKKYEDKSSEYSPENIRQLIEIGISSAEQELEETVEKFLEGNQNLPEFLENFMKVKKLIAARKFKEERLNFQLRQMKQ
jgi:polyribonucleotide nucleotidyltransferase